MINSQKKIANQIRAMVQKSREGDEFVGFLGNLNGVVQADKFNNVYVLIQGIEFIAYNEKVPKIAFLPVRIAKRSGRLQVIEARNVFHRTTYVNVPDHDHTWGRSNNPTWVRGEQFLPGLVIPHDSGLSVHFTGLIYWLDGAFRLALAQDIDLSSFIPASGARFGLLEADDDGIVSVNLGDNVGAPGLLTYADIPEPSADKKPLNFAVKLYAGQTRIQQGLDFTSSDVVDLRWSGFGSGGGGGGTPAGDNGEIQFNDDGAFGASSNLKLTTDDVLVLGTPSPHIIAAPLSIAQGRSGGSAIHYQFTFGDETFYSRLVGYHARGTLESSSATLANDILQAIIGRGYWGADAPNPVGAELRIVATENHEEDEYGTAFELWVVPNGSDTRTKIATIDEDGINLVSGTQYLVNGAQHTHDGEDVNIDASGFSGNLDGSVTDVQLLADAVDALTVGGGGREVLTADRTYYVRTDGNDSNNGLANTSGGAFLTIQKAIDTVAGLDLSIYNVTIQVADGTYTGAVLVNGSWLGSGIVTLQGNSGTPANVLISVTSNNAIKVQNGGSLTIKDFELRTTTSGDCLQADTNASVSLSNLRFGACAGLHIYALNGGAITVTGNYTISGGAIAHWVTNTSAAIVCASKTITLSGTPAFSGRFASLSFVSSMSVDGNTFSGSATGSRYNVQHNSVLYTGGAGANYLPGNSAGVTSTGGQYI